MRPTTRAPLALAALLLATQTASAGPAGRIRDLEGGFLAKIADRLGLPEATRKAGKAILDKYDPIRKERRGAALAALASLEAAYDAAPGDAAALQAKLAALRQAGEALHAMRKQKHEDLANLLDARQKVKVAARFLERRDPAKHEGKGEWVIANVVPAFLRWIGGMDEASVTSISAILAERRPLRDALRTEGKALRSELIALAADPALDEAKAELAVAKARSFGAKVEATVRAGLDQIEAKVPAPDRAKLVVRLYKGAKRVAKFVKRIAGLAELDELIGSGTPVPEPGLDPEADGDREDETR